MSGLRKIDRTDMVQALSPLEGPHTAESVVAASMAVAELWRYLAHATRYSTAEALTDPADVSVAVGNFVAGMRSADQVLGQLSYWAQRLTENPALADDRDRANVTRAVAATEEVASWLVEARDDMSMVVRDLGEVSADLGHLSLRRGVGQEQRS
ncbi:hypothetical protein ACFXPS_30980 [Nocardia sp. NPDC059091]|uniref:hypothetical protein n=1 Tax=Nocardia sp. NPDC059091 TaxID=3346724 RepID=UPI0036C884D0